MNISSKKIIVFDLDGTLTPSKSPMDEEMSDLLCGLLTQKKVAVIAGGQWKQFKDQFLGHLQCLEENLPNLYLFPTMATRFYRYEHSVWQEVYADVLSEEERTKIKDSFQRAFEEIGYNPEKPFSGLVAGYPEKVYGEVIEDRGTQITFSALGQDIVKELGEEGLKRKTEWKKANQELKMAIVKKLGEYLPEYSVSAGGFTSIDVTKKGINKAYGVRQIEKLLGIPIAEMLFVGDALYPGGNDYAAIETGVETVAVSGPEETKKLIQGWIN